MPDRSDRIDPRKLEFVWAQIAADIRRDIERGTLRPGDKLESELDLAASYGVARMTVRRAITELADQGVLVVLRGRGTYVSDATSPER